MMKRDKIVLEALQSISEPHGELCRPFSMVLDECFPAEMHLQQLSLDEVKDSCRYLRQEGLAEFHRGLMNEDGEVCGSGYCISTLGVERLREVEHVTDEQQS